ncbi:MAG: hypothetical protein ISS82_04520, partial [Nanoarchaeota archaeon]|nr:hypothetical protein [Nanoarchaeota archaeon]
YITIFGVLVIGLFIAGCSGPVARNIIPENGGSGGGSSGDEVTYQGVLDMLQYNTFSPSIEVLPNGYDTTCAEICQSNDNSYCVYAEGKINLDPLPERYPITCQTEVFVLGENGVQQIGAIDDFRCMCALPPA